MKGFPRIRRDDTGTTTFVIVPPTKAVDIRHELNLTQDAFAELLGVSLATVRKWERGTGEPSGVEKTLLAVARLHPEAIREAVEAGK